MKANSSVEVLPDSKTAEQIKLALQQMGEILKEAGPVKAIREVTSSFPELKRAEILRIAERLGINVHAAVTQYHVARKGVKQAPEKKVPAKIKTAAAAIDLEAESKKAAEEARNQVVSKNGYTRGQLSEKLNLVVPAGGDWKAPLGGWVSKANLAMVKEAITFFTATTPKVRFNPSNKKYWVKSEGYPGWPSWR